MRCGEVREPHLVLEVVLVEQRALHSVEVARRRARSIGVVARW